MLAYVYLQEVAELQKLESLTNLIEISLVNNAVSVFYSNKFKSC